ncbi:MAG: hypothetical protein MJ003_02190 [Paludibacteraceae bacterium]|nr:hypothetical protein [Paludibacteraceae bacterium]
MKTVKFILAMATVLIALTGCEKKTPVEQESKGEEEQKVTTGYAEVKAEAGVPENKVKWIQLWADGPKFAEFNVGATAVGEYGGYYAWGGSQDKVDDHYTGSKNIQGGDFDTAKNLWGSKWKMPTKKDLENLIKNCNTEWTTNYNNTGKAGRVFTGKTEGYTGNSIFIPAAGLCIFGTINDAGSNGQCWSATPNDSSTAYYITVSEAKTASYSFNRSRGFSVRAILAE